MWVCFGIAVVVLLFLDLCVFNRKNEVPSFAHTLWVCIAYIGAGLLFGVFVWYEEGTNKAMEYFTGFLVEKSLSMDNIFVMSIIFTSIGVPRIYQHRVLFWGILGAIVMRALLIGVGEALIKNFHWVLYVFSAFLVYTGVKMALHSAKKETENDEDNIKNSAVYRFVEKYFPVTHEIDGPHFVTRKNGKHYITPLFFALITIELMDVVFALDSIPAIFLLTDDVFIVYTSNIFAILGLRALYFLLEAAVHRFVYLKQALSIVLIFIGLKIFLPKIGIELETWHSLTVTFSLLFGSIILSLFKEKKTAGGKAGA